MSQTTQDDIIAAAMTLPREVKVKLAEQLLDSAEPIDEKEIDALWVIEIHRRLQDLEEGKAHTIPAEEIFRSLDARLDRDR
jgi:putative addiction module component (TIGR02574 family)